MKSKILLILGMAFAAVAGFQNCSAKLLSKETRTNNSGTGQGYGGKAYIHVQLAVCADGSSVESRVLIKSPSEATVQRENCETLSNPRVLTADKISAIPLTPELLNVDLGSGVETFTFEAPLPTLFVQISYVQMGAGPFNTFLSLNFRNGSDAINGYGGIGCTLTEASTGKAMFVHPLPNGTTINEEFIHGLFVAGPGEFAGGFSGGGYATNPQPVEGLEYLYVCRFVYGAAPAVTIPYSLDDLGLPTIVTNAGKLRFTNGKYIIMSEAVTR